MLLLPSNRTGENPLWTSSEPYYDDLFTIWDLFRCQTALFQVLQPTPYEEYIRSLIDVYRHVGWMPDARSSNFNGRSQGGSNADNVLADAYVKGVRGAVNWDDGYAAMVKDAEVVPPNDPVDPESPESSDHEGRGALPVLPLDHCVARPANPQVGLAKVRLHNPRLRPLRLARRRLLHQRLRPVPSRLRAWQERRRIQVPQTLPQLAQPLEPRRHLPQLHGLPSAAQRQRLLRPRGPAILRRLLLGRLLLRSHTVGVLLQPVPRHRDTNRLRRRRCPLRQQARSALHTKPQPFGVRAVRLHDLQPGQRAGLRLTIPLQFRRPPGSKREVQPHDRHIVLRADPDRSAGQLRRRRHAELAPVERDWLVSADRHDDVPGRRAVV